MKKLFLIPLFVATAAFAGSIGELNTEIARLLAPFQNEQTIARMSFANIETNSERALSVAVSAFFQKVGNKNTVSIDVQNLAYAYGDGSAPTTTVKGAVGVDLTKILPQDQLNELIPNAEQMIADIVKEYAGKYGEALTLTVQIIERTQDEAGNYTGIKGRISFAFDFTKLPEGVAKEEIPVSQGTVTLSLKVSEGASVDATVVSNTSYKGFQEDNQGLKEILDSLLNREERAMEEIVDLVKKLDEAAGSIVNEEE